jgi:lipid-binding SYLF domain-containing protein
MSKSLAVIALCALLVFAPPAHAVSEQQDLVNRADVVLQSLRSNPDYSEVDDLMKDAKAVFIVPQLLKAAFFIGGEGGDGVIVSRFDDGSWSGPAFYVIGSASFGLQFGAKSSEVVFIIRTEKGLKAILDENVKLGGDVSVALVTVGKGLGAGTGFKRDADIYAVSQADGLFAGAAFDGSIISSRDEWDADYYGQPYVARDILWDGKGKGAPGADRLVQDLR